MATNKIKTQIVVDPTVDKSKSTLTEVLGLTESQLEVNGQVLAEELADLVMEAVRTGKSDKVDIALMLEQFDQDILNYFLVNTMNEMILNQAQDIKNRQSLGGFLGILKRGLDGSQSEE